jgi:hypothetical protein
MELQLRRFSMARAREGAADAKAARVIRSNILLRRDILEVKSLKLKVKSIVQN